MRVKALNNFFYLDCLITCPLVFSTAKILGFNHRLHFNQILFGDWDLEWRGVLRGTSWPLGGIGFRRGLNQSKDFLILGFFAYKTSKIFSINIFI